MSNLKNKRKKTRLIGRESCTPNISEKNSKLIEDYISKKCSISHPLYYISQKRTRNNLNLIGTVLGRKGFKSLLNNEKAQKKIVSRSSAQLISECSRDKLVKNKESLIDGLKLDLRNLLEWLNGGVLPKSASWIDEERARAIADVVKWGIGILLIYILVNIVMTLLDQVQIPSEFVFKPLILISLVWILSLQYHNLKLGRWESPWKVCDRVMDKLCNPYIVFALGVGMIILQVTALWFQSQNLSYPLPLKMVEKDPNYILLMQDSMESFESTICDGGNSIYPGPVMGEKMWCQLNFSYKPNPKYKLSTVTVSGWTYQSNGSDLVQNFNLESGGSRFSVPLDQPHYNPLRFYFQVRKDGENQTDDNRSIAVDYSNFKTPQPQEIENEKKERFAVLIGVLALSVISVFSMVKNIKDLTEEK